MVSPEESNITIYCPWPPEMSVQKYMKISAEKAFSSPVANTSHI